MNNFLEKNKEILKRIKYRITVSVHKLSSGPILRKNKRNNNPNGPIVFVGQCEAIWGKASPVFRELIKLTNNAKILIVPDSQIENKGMTIFEKQFPNNVLFYKKNILKELKPSIVVFTRPYDSYLPNDLHIKNVAKITKTAYIPYYFSTDALYFNGFDTIFNCYLNYYFADQKMTYDYFCETRRKNIKKGLQEAFNLGYPSLERKNLIQPIKRIEKNKMLVIWAPRWTTNPDVGGSNFFNYVDQMLDFFTNNDEYIFVFRPHPLLFSNFLKTGELSKEKMNDILNKIQSSDNCYYDNTANYLDLYNASDVLICDLSSMIFEYFALNKPMIFTPVPCKNANLPFTDQIVDINFTANSFDEIISCLREIKTNKELKAINSDLYKNFINQNDNASENIARKIIEIANRK